MSAHSVGPWELRGNYVYDATERPVARVLLREHDTAEEAEANKLLLAGGPDLVVALDSAARALEESAKVFAGPQCDLPSLGSIIREHAERARAALQALRP